MKLTNANNEITNTFQETCFGTDMNKALVVTQGILPNIVMLLFQDVFDKDVFQNDFMGTVALTVDEIKEASKVKMLFACIC